MQAFGALRHAHYRLLWAGHLFSGFGQGMQLLATGWLVILVAAEDGRPELGPFYLGLLGLSRAVPALLFGLFGGVIADWFDRCVLLWISRAVAFASAVILAALTLAGQVHIGHLMLVTLAGAAASAFSGPAQQVMLARVVPHADLMSAVSLNQGTFQLTKLVGPLLAGPLIILTGVGGAMAVSALVFLGSVAFMIGVPASPPEVSPDHRRSAAGALSSLADGFRYAAGNPRIRWILITSAVAGIVARPVESLLPAVAHDVLGVGATELSWLTAAQALGSIGGTALAASLGRVRRRGLIVSAAIIAWGAAAAAFGLERSLVPSILLSAAIGLPHWVFSGTMLVVLQTHTPDRLRGRVMSIHLWTVMGISQFGVLFMGAAGTLIGIGPTIVAGGALFALFGLVLFLRIDAIRNLNNEDGPAEDSRRLVR